MSIPRGTTPTFTLTFTEQGLDLTRANNVYVTFERGGRNLTKSGSNLVIQEKSIQVYLDQRETLQFTEGQVEIQVNWTGANGNRVASDIKTVDFSKQLLRRVIE